MDSRLNPFEELDRALLRNEANEWPRVCGFGEASFAKPCYACIGYCEALEFTGTRGERDHHVDDVLTTDSPLRVDQSDTLLDLILIIEIGCRPNAVMASAPRLVKG